MAVAAGIEDEEYYHGLLPREDLAILLQHDGDFLVRISEPKAGSPRQIIISVVVDERLENKMKHIVVQHVINGKVMTDPKRFFNNVKELIEYFRRTKEPVIHTVSTARLLNCVKRAPWELRHRDIVLQKKLGEGAFGEVHSGTYKLPSGRVVTVAIKLAKVTEMSKEKIKELMKEARLMRNYDHPNVVRMYGVAVAHEPLLIVMELVEGGALDEYLKKNVVDPRIKLEKMVVASAWGLEYLHSKNCIHRDIAARNCLYTNKNIVKISDFGLSREGTQYQMKKVERLPIRWLAPETIRYLIYTSRTDVWSFGIMAWEIYADGKEPYLGMSSKDVKEKVMTGYKMAMPQCTQPEVGTTIRDMCWNLIPELRGTMSQVARKLEQLSGLQPPIMATAVTPDALIKPRTAGLPTANPAQNPSGVPRFMTIAATQGYSRDQFTGNRAFTAQKKFISGANPRACSFERRRFGGSRTPRNWPPPAQAGPPPGNCATVAPTICFGQMGIPINPGQILPPIARGAIAQPRNGKAPMARNNSSDQVAPPSSPIQVAVPPKVPGGMVPPFSPNPSPAPSPAVTPQNSENRVVNGTPRNYSGENKCPPFVPPTPTGTPKAMHSGSIVNYYRLPIQPQSVSTSRKKAGSRTRLSRNRRRQGRRFF